MLNFESIPLTGDRYRWISGAFGQKSIGIHLGLRAAKPNGSFGCCCRKIANVFESLNHHRGVSDILLKGQTNKPTRQSSDRSHQMAITTASSKFLAVLTCPSILHPKLPLDHLDKVTSSSSTTTKGWPSYQHRRQSHRLHRSYLSQSHHIIKPLPTDCRLNWRQDPTTIQARSKLYQAFPNTYHHHIPCLRRSPRRQGISAFILHHQRLFLPP